MRNTVLWKAAFGGIFMATGGALVMAGWWPVAFVVSLAGVGLLLAADRRLREVEQAFHVMYNRPSGWVR